jgi:hypothetical protein
MEVQNVTKELEANIQVWTDKKAKREEDFLRTKETIKQLHQELKVIQNDIAILHGAIQGYRGAVEVVSKSGPENHEVVKDGSA